MEFDRIFSDMALKSWSIFAGAALAVRLFGVAFDFVLGTFYLKLWLMSGILARALKAGVRGEAL